MLSCREHRTFFTATFVCSWLVLAFTSPGIPIVWDEGEYLGRAQIAIDWFRYMPASLSEEGIFRHWLFIRYAEGHPAGFVLPIAIGKWLGSPVLDPLTAARLGPITLFSLACAAIAVRLKTTYGRVAAIVAPVALLTFPRIFSEAHFATQDGQLTAWWLLLWVVQSSSSIGMASSMALGIVLGFTTATKFSGWCAWGPLVAGQLLQRNATAFLRLAVAVPVALLVFYIVNPPLWYSPLDGMREHFGRNLGRATTIDITTWFMGNLHSMTRPLPWYNTLVWLMFVTPLPTLALGIVGLTSCLRRPTPFSVTLVLHWITLMIVRALPGAPPHDGIRLFLPAFGFWCVLAGIGAQRVFGFIATLSSASWRLALRAAIVAALIGNAINLARYYPQTLSHYNLIAGGLRGAANKGMEPAYWWDGLDEDVINWLNEHTSTDEAVAFAATANIGYVREYRGLRARAVFEPRKFAFKWYVLQNRPGVFTRIDRTLMGQHTPAFAKYPGRRRAAERPPPDLDVPVIAIFSYEQFQQVVSGRRR